MFQFNPLIHFFALILVTFSGTLERVTEEDIIEDDSNTQTQEAHATEQKPSMDTVRQL